MLRFKAYDTNGPDVEKVAPFSVLWDTTGPTGGTGVDGDYFFQYDASTTGGIYKKVSGSWVSTHGATGPTGATGSLPSGQTGQILYYTGGTWTNVYSFAGVSTVTSGVSTLTITFGITLPNTGYSLQANWSNITDSNPQFQPIVVTTKGTTGAAFKWNSNTDSANYSIEWSVRQY